MRTKCSLGLLLAASLSFSYGGAADSAPSSLAPVTQAAVDRAVEFAHTTLWSKFIGADGLIHDYVGDLPTPEECALGKPNAIGWWSPIENGPMFTGTYLAAICQRAHRSGAAADREKTRRLAKGLLKDRKLLFCHRTEARQGNVMSQGGLAGSGRRPPP